MTQITAKYVNPAKEGKRYGTIKTPEGQTYMLPVGMTDAFTQGQTYDVPVKQETWGAGVSSAGGTRMAACSPPRTTPAAGSPCRAIGAT